MPKKKKLMPKKQATKDVKTLAESLDQKKRKQASKRLTFFATQGGKIKVTPKPKKKKFKKGKFFKN